MLELTAENYILSTVNQDGTESHAVYATPVRMKDVNGDWQLIDTTIDPITHIPKLVPYQVKFEEFITSDSAIQFDSSVGTASFGLKLFGLDGAEVAEQSLPAQISGNIISYTLSWGRIVYEVLSTSIKETIYIERNILSDPSVSGMTLDGLCLNIDFGLPPLSFESPLSALDAKTRHVPVVRSSTGIKIAYTDYSKATLPIAVDPTISTVQMGSGYGWLNETSAFGSAAEPATDLMAGTYSGGSGKATFYSNYRYFGRYSLSNYVNATIYGTCVWQYYVTTQTGAIQLQLDEMVDWGGASFSASAVWNATVKNALGVLPQVYTVYNNSGDIKQSLVVAKKLTSSNSVFAIRVKGVTEPRDVTPRNVTHFNGAGATYPTSISFNAYSTFTQDAPSVSGTSVTVNWTNGGGLVSGDYHKIYYAIGTGLTAAQIIAAGNMPVQSSGYAATSAVVNGLTAGTTYSFVIVDTQVVGGVGYEGAQSSIQQATLTGGGDTIPPTITLTEVDTEDFSPLTLPYVVSKLTGKSSFTVKFMTDENVQAWRIELGGVGQGTGTLLSSGGAVLANTLITSVIDVNSFGTSFQTDGAYRINVYAQDIVGNWTPYNQP